MQLLFITLLLFTLNATVFSKAIVDSDVLAELNQSIGSKSLRSKPSSKSPESMVVFIFLKPHSDINELLQDIQNIPEVTAKPLHFMSAIVAIIPSNPAVVKRIEHHPDVAQISSNKISGEELDVSAQAILLKPSETYPDVHNWWQQGYTGQQGILGLIDSGVAIEHPGLINKTIIVRQEPGSDYTRYIGGVRSAHATGAACIYSGTGYGSFPRERGIAYGLSTLLTGLAGEGAGEKEDLLLTTTTLDWMLTRASIRPTLINYSFGNGLISCKTCPDWSGLAKIVDYIVNHEKIMWVKSAGNQGYISPKNTPPFASTMTVPADNYNAMTVANMNPTIIEKGRAYQTPNRARHAIRYTSSRGPTLLGRKKPDISAPGNDTRTCAPDPKTYQLHYTPSMDYRDGYRLMGGTSSAAPHVGGALLLLQDAGIQNPMTQKALLINSADAWTDSGKPGPDDPNHAYTGGHFQVQGSEWNPTYGWGYLNMQNAFEQKDHLIESELSLEHRTQEYVVFLPIGGKVTLVHERRVGYSLDNAEWQLSHLSLALYDADTKERLMEDDSLIDTVHQVANCERAFHQKNCSPQTIPRRVIIRVSLLSETLDGSTTEPFSLAFG